MTSALPASALQAWQRLEALASADRQPALRDLVQDAARASEMRLSFADLTIDFSRQRVTEPIRSALLDLAQERGLREWTTAMMRGSKVNVSEDRAALHTALRLPDLAAASAAARPPSDCWRLASQERSRLLEFADQLRRGEVTGYAGKPFRDLVHLGVGGSSLGPELAIQALAGADSPLRLHFLANIDGADFIETMHGLNPETTGFVLASKSFGTLETEINAASVRSWLLERTGAGPKVVARHCFGVTANVQAAREFGLDDARIFRLWDWVGGRFSIWSSVGLPIAVALGSDGYQSLLDGALAADRHFADSPAAANAPLLAALFDIWNFNFLGLGHLTLLPYDHRLRLLPEYLCQLFTESNGKRVCQDGSPAGIGTMPVVWGGVGTPGQHAFHQLLHQGTSPGAADFILIGQPDHELPRHHQWLLANGLAQGQALANGWSSQDPHRQAPGGRPSTTLILPRLTPATLGALLAFYEHRCVCQAAIWNINPFDQWGVEFGKAGARALFERLSGVDDFDQDAATAGMIRQLTGQTRPSA